MKIRLLLAMPDAESEELMQALLKSAMCLVPLDVTSHQVYSRGDLLTRARENQDDVILVDWQMAGAETPDLVRELVALNYGFRIMVLLPLQLRQYRQTLWEAGACSSIPKEYLDQEWLSTALCLMNRAMEREARIVESTKESVHA